jgi:hypothetical protein
MQFHMAHTELQIEKNTGSLILSINCSASLTAIITFVKCILQTPKTYHTEVILGKEMHNESGHNLDLPLDQQM